MSESSQAFWFRHRDGYSVIAFPKELGTAHMGDIRDAAVKVIEQLAAVKTPSCVVDLTSLDYMGSSLVASIIRIWKSVKEKGGQMVVVAPNQQIVEVLQTTGLTKVWTVVETFELAVHSLGYSPEARVEKRERRILAFVGPAALVLGAITIAIRVLPHFAAIKQTATALVYGIMGLSVVASAISTFRESGWRRALSIIVFLIAAPLLGWFVWYEEVRIPIDDLTPPSEEFTLPLPPLKSTESGDETSVASDGEVSVEESSGDETSGDQAGNRATRPQDSATDNADTPDRPMLRLETAGQGTAEASSVTPDEAKTDPPEGDGSGIEPSKSGGQAPPAPAIDAPDKPASADMPPPQDNNASSSDTAPAAPQSDLTVDGSSPGAGTPVESVD
ncbi:MAG: STAS domain-containing protein [Planctomycetaceae bacterium]|nr:STAS domain-containing protein [Planctomycetaceae bacterium]